MNSVRVLCTIPLIFSLAAVSCASKDEPPAAAATACDTLAAYKATTTVAPTFAADIVPILTNAVSSGAGCSTQSICHATATPASLKTGLFMAGSTDPTLRLDDTPAAVMGELMGASFSAPGMKLVTPGNVGASFLAHKISNSGTSVDTLSCMASQCNSQSSGKASACGGAMPMAGLGTLSAAQRTTILDWIALGAMP